MDKLLIHELVAECRIGVTQREQARPQRIGIDLELDIDAAQAARQDSVREAIDYAKLVTAVKRLAEQKSYHLMETMAENIAMAILAQFKTPHVLVRVKKRALQGIDYAAVEVKRSR